jgi:hypothetical protein
VEPSSIIASSRCSTETYSSLSRLAASSARTRICCNALMRYLARLDARTRDPGLALQPAVDLGLERLGRNLLATEQTGDQRFRLLQEGEEKMLAIHLLQASTSSSASSSIGPAASAASSW